MAAAEYSLVWLVLPEGRAGRGRPLIAEPQPAGPVVGAGQGSPSAERVSSSRLSGGPGGGAAEARGPISILLRDWGPIWTEA